MLSLSLLRLPRDHPRWRHLDPYQAHQLIWTAFPDIPEGNRSFLFSLDARTDHHSLLVQSTCPPDWGRLQNDADVRTKSFDPGRVPVEARLRFFLRANPTVDRKGYSSGKQRIGVGLNPALAFERMGRAGEAPSTPEAVAAWRRAELLDWLTRKGARGGFRIVQAEPGPIVERRIARGARQRTRPMTFHEVEFTGELEVFDVEAFAATVSGGIGRAKAFGYGLLMARPA